MVRRLARDDLHVRPLVMVSGRLVFVLALAFALVLCGCSGKGGRPEQGTPAASAGGLSGRLILTERGALVEEGVDGGQRKTLLAPAGGDAAYLYPSVSPDGTSIAFISQPTPQTSGPVSDSGADLWVADRGGSGARRVFRHAAMNQQIVFPQWQDATHILTVAQELDANGVSYVLERFDTDTGERAQVSKDVLTFGVSSDGQSIAVVRLDASGGLALSFMNADGTGERTLLSARDGLSPFGWPRFSPDRKRIAFTAAETPMAIVGIRYTRFDPIARPALDGPPQDVWIVDAAGGRPARLAAIKEDSPSLTWNGDGSRVYAVGAKAVYEINIENGATREVSAGIFHSHLAWAPD